MGSGECGVGNPPVGTSLSSNLCMEDKAALGKDTHMFLGVSSGLHGCLGVLKKPSKRSESKPKEEACVWTPESGHGVWRREHPCQEEHSTSRWGDPSVEVHQPRHCTACQWVHERSSRATEKGVMVSPEQGLLLTKPDSHCTSVCLTW